MWILAILMAIILAVFAYRYMAVLLGGRYWWVGKLCAALAVALVAYVVADNSSHYLLKQASGDSDLASNGLVRGLLVMGFSLVMGYWTWIFYRVRNPED